MAEENFCHLFFPGDYLRDTQNFSPATQVAYDRIMCEHVRNISVSHLQLQFFTKNLTDLEKQELMLALHGDQEQGYYIPWVKREVIKRREFSKSRSANRSTPNKKTKKRHIKKKSVSYEEHMELEKEKELEKGRIDGVPWPAFEDFWNAYQKKVDPKKCRKLWGKISQPDKEKIMQHIPLYIESQPDKQYRKNPETYLRNESWNDEIITRDGRSTSANQQQRTYPQAPGATGNTSTANNGYGAFGGG